MIFPWKKFFLHTKFIFLTCIPLILISRQPVAMEGSIWVAGVGRKLLSNCFNILTAWTTSSKHRQCAPNALMFVRIRPIQSLGQVSPDDCVYMASMRFQTMVVIPCLGYRQPRPLPASPHGSHRMGELQVPGNIRSQMKFRETSGHEWITKKPHIWNSGKLWHRWKGFS